MIPVSMSWFSASTFLGKHLDMRKGHTDAGKRERIRELASDQLTAELPVAQRWALRIQVWKRDSRPFDIENMSKPIADAFCQRQIERDNSNYVQLGL